MALNGLLLGQSQASVEDTVLTGFQQFPKVAQSGITRKKAATGATYSQPRRGETTALSAPYTHPE